MNNIEYRYSTSVGITVKIILETNCRRKNILHGNVSGFPEDPRQILFALAKITKG